MPRTVKEIVELKLNSLQGKVHYAEHCVDKLHNSLESLTLPLELNSLNVALDNMILSVDEFVANFDEVLPGLGESSEKKVSKGGASHIPSTQSQASSNDTECAGRSGLDDLVSRMKKLEESMCEMRSTIHGGGDGEGGPHRGVMSHLSVLENSFNEGTQKLISMEERMQDISIFRNEMGAKTVKEDQQREMDNISWNKRIQSLEVENVTLCEEFKNVKGKLKETIIENDSYEQRLVHLEDAIKSVKEIGITFEDQTKDLVNVENKFQDLVSDINSYKQRLICVEDAVKSVKSVSVTSQDQERELESIAVKRFEELESKFQDVVSDTDACKKKLTSVEDELKTVNAVIETKEDSRKESEIKHMNERIGKLEKSFEITLSDTDACKQTISHVEDQSESVTPVRGAHLDSLTKTQILQRISDLENRPAVAFEMALKHDGPWIGETVIQAVDYVDFNVGNGFQKDQCRFLAPVDGIYCMSLYLCVKNSQKSSVYLEACDEDEKKWNARFCQATAESQINSGANCDVGLVSLRKGEVVRAKLDMDGVFDTCIIYGWLVLATK